MQRLYMASFLGFTTSHPRLLPWMLHISVATVLEQLLGRLCQMKKKGLVQHPLQRWRQYWPHTHPCALASWKLVFPQLPGTSFPQSSLCLLVLNEQQWLHLYRSLPGWVGSLAQMCILQRRSWARQHQHAVFPLQRCSPGCIESERWKVKCNRLRNSGKWFSCCFFIAAKETLQVFHQLR